MLLLAAALAGAAPAPHSAWPGAVEMAQLSFRSRMVVRVQTLHARRHVVQTYREKKGPRCVPMNDILGAAVLDKGGVDFVMRGGQRMRARLASSCPGLDYYSGFYILPPANGLICSDRDVVRDRAGGECPIDRFRKLVPKMDD
ncbi:hypothetical protein [uncultured Sphingomonas sp.]|uniref:hypothetical protein n=1 Tax=uncultured Sphingomonas sp. TaxID=158754 RepID=UPI0025E70E56|nr:hypothetical protein [uncultured Sphingomonas sp.]